jgi:hypothetical protein
MTLTPSLSGDAIADQIVEEETTTNLVGVIETVIASLAADNTAMVNRNESGHLWKFKYGTVEVFVQLTGQSDEDALTVWSAVLKLPAKDEPKLMRQLLERNWSNTLEARFGIVNNEIVVVTTRSLADLSPGELSRAITIVATIADESDEPLLQEFGL